MRNSDQTPLLSGNNPRNYHTNAINNSDSPSTSTNDINQASNSTVINFENNWIECESRYDGETQKRLNKGEWEYRTFLPDQTIINESFIDDNNKYWRKIYRYKNKQVDFSLFSFQEKTMRKNRRLYENDDVMVNSLKDLDFNNLDLSNFPEKNRTLTLETKFLEGVAIDTINNINQFMENIKSFNEELETFREKPNHNLQILLKLYQHLTVLQNFIDSTKPTTNTSITSQGKSMLDNITNAALGLILIYIGLTGKNLQRVVSNYTIDGTSHTASEYMEAIFLNWQNYVMVFVDTALGTFLTSAASNWSRDVIFNKQKQKINFTGQPFNYDELEKFKALIQTRLYEENHEQLMPLFPKISGINDLMKKFNDMETSNPFPYHPHFTKEIENINNIIELRSNNNNDTTNIIASNNDNDKEIEQVITASNKTIKHFQKPNAASLPLTKKIWYCISDTGLELATWAVSHTMIAGASANTTHEDFEISDWPGYIINSGALIANGSRYIIMRPINNIFKAGLSILGIPTSLGLIMDKLIGLVSSAQPYAKLIKWVDMQPRSIKLIFAAPLFLVITTITNIVKTEASLVTEAGFAKSLTILKSRLEKALTWLFFGLTTASDMFTFAVSDFYKIFHKFDILKNIWKIGSKCFGENEVIATSLTNNFEKLEKNDKLPTFTEEYTKHQNIDVDPTTHSINETTAASMEPFNQNLVNESQPIPSSTSTNNESYANFYTNTIRTI